MPQITKKISKNKKKLLMLFFFFFLAVSLPVTAYFIGSERSFDDRGRAWYNIDFGEEEAPSWTNIDFGNKETPGWVTDPGSSSNDTSGNISDTTRDTSTGSTGGVEITSFSISPSEVKLGARVTVRWSSKNATTCSLNGSPGSGTSGSESYTTSKVGTHTYTLVCSNSSGGRDSKSTKLTVTGSAQTGSTGSVEITSFSISPSKVQEGGTITVQWSSKNATSCTLNGRSVPTSDSGSGPISRGVGTHNYELICRNSSGSASKRAILTVTGSDSGQFGSTGGVEIPTFSISPSEIKEGGTITVQWSSKNATSCTMNGLTAPTNESRTGSATRGVGTHNYELVCSNSSGSVSKKASFTVKSSESTQTGSTDETEKTTDEWTIGICGRLDGRTFPSDVGDWPSDNFCSLGTAEPSSPAFPSVGNSVSWDCIGTSFPDSCSASRQDSSSASSSLPVDVVPDLIGGCTIDEHCRAQAPFELCFKNTCLPGNVKNDGKIGMPDFVNFKEDFVSYKMNGWSEILRRSDINTDGRISMSDYSVFVKSYRLVNGLE